jgi:hypothetical protein
MEEENSRVEVEEGQHIQTETVEVSTVDRRPT